MNGTDCGPASSAPSDADGCPANPAAGTPVSDVDVECLLADRADLLRLARTAGGTMSSIANLLSHLRMDSAEDQQVTDRAVTLLRRAGDSLADRARTWPTVPRSAELRGRS